METTGDIVVERINQKRDEIILAIKRQLTNVEPVQIQNGDALGKICSFLFCVVVITKNYMFLIFDLLVWNL